MITIQSHCKTEEGEAVQMQVKNTWHSNQLRLQRSAIIHHNPTLSPHLRASAIKEAEDV